MKPQRNEIFIWSIAITLAIMWHIFIWMRFSMAEKTPPPPPPKAPELSFIPPYTEGEAASVDSQARTLMTPVLFSLPSTVGFSKPIIEYRAGMLQDQYTPEEDLALLKTSNLDRDRKYLVWPRHMDSQVAYLLNNPMVSNPRTTLRPNTIVPPKAKTHYTVQGDFSSDDLDASRIEIDEDIADSNTWRAEAMIEFDESGLPVRGFLTESTGNTELDQAIVTALYQWRLKHTKAPASGYVNLEHN